MITPHHDDWLLVFDSYDDIQVDIQKLIPSSLTGTVLITSRNRNVVGSVATSWFALQTMDAESAEHLFLRIQSFDVDNTWVEPRTHPEYPVLKKILQEL